LGIWHSCETDGCNSEIRVEHSSFPYCNDCEIKELSKLDYSIKGESIKIPFTYNEYNGGK
jgi:hypothetical protein